MWYSTQSFGQKIAIKITTGREPSRSLDQKRVMTSTCLT